MKVRASVRRMCEKCKIVRRRGVVFVVCADPRHKQRQGWRPMVPAVHVAAAPRRWTPASRSSVCRFSPSTSQP